MKQIFFKSIALALLVVALLAGGKVAKADVVGVGLGYQFEPSRIAIDLLIPLKHHGAKRPQGGVLNLGLNIMGSSQKQRSRLRGRNFDWIGFSLPIAYEYVFDSGISILGGAEFVYFSNDGNSVFNSITSYNKDTTYGGGVVLGTHYFFKSGVFLGLRVSTGVGYSSTYESSPSASEVKHTTVSGYAAPTLSVGYMF